MERCASGKGYTHLTNNESNGIGSKNCTINTNNAATFALPGNEVTRLENLPKFDPCEMCDKVGKRRNTLSAFCGRLWTTCTAMYAPTLCPIMISRGLCSVKEENGPDETIVSTIRTLFSICSCNDKGLETSKSSCPASETPRIVVLGESSCNVVRNSS